MKSLNEIYSNLCMAAVLSAAAITITLPTITHAQNVVGAITAPSCSVTTLGQVGTTGGQDPQPCVGVPHDM